MSPYLLVIAALLGGIAGCSDSAVEAPEPLTLSRHVNALLNDPTPLPSQAVAEPAAATVVDEPVPATEESPDGGATTNQADAGVEAVANESATGTDEALEAAAPAPVAPPPPVERPSAPSSPKRIAIAPAPRARVRKPVAAAPPKRRPARAKPARRAPTRVAKRSPPPLPKVPESTAEVPSDLDATDLYHRGQTLLKQAKYSDAIACLSKSQKLRPSARTLTKLGQAYFDAHQLKKAEQVLRRAGNHAPAILMLGTLYQQTGQQSRARQVYKAFLAKFPNHRRAGWVRTILQAL